MAFTSRAPRRLGTVSGGCSGGIGPGAYNVAALAAAAPSRVNAVPFASSSARPLGPDVNLTTPGPGAYDAPAAAASARSSSRGSGPSAAFRSTTGRVSLVRQTDAPAPGKYDTRPKWGKKQGPRAPRRGGGDREGFAWRGADQVPSIPSGARSYGFEETEAGELVPQTAPAYAERGPAGNVRRREAAGPAWSRSKSKRKAFTGSADGPSPADYAPAAARGGGGGGARPTATFASASSRFAGGPGSGGGGGGGEPTPGPGQYSTDGSATARRRAQRPQVQCFGSTAPRLSAPARGAEGAVVGPGSYFRTQPFLGAAAREQFASPDDEGVARAPFMSTASRFGRGAPGAPSDGGVEGAPGPASYTVTRDVSEELSRRRFGRNTSFGTTSRRFDDPVQRANSWKIGPGAHHRPQSAPRDAGRPSAAFASRAPRFRGRRAEGPAPGQYEPARAKPRRVGKRGLLASGEPRFGSRPAAAKEDTPGPGMYADGAAAAAPASTRGAAVSSFRSAAPRLAPARTVEGPGPGSYDTGASSLVRASFNITIGPEI